MIYERCPVEAMAVVVWVLAPGYGNLCSNKAWPSAELDAGVEVEWHRKRWLKRLTLDACAMQICASAGGWMVC